MELRAAGAPIGVTVVFPGRVPSRLGRPPDTPDEPVAPLLEPGIVAAEDIGRMVVDAVVNDRPFLFTHPERIAEVEQRFARITANP